MSPLVSVVVALLAGSLVLASGSYWHGKSTRRRNRRLGERGPLTSEELYRRHYAGSNVTAETCAWARRTVARAAEIPCHEVIRPTDAFDADLAPIGWDDVGVVDIAVATEDYIGRPLPDRDFEPLNTVDDFIRYVCGLELASSGKR